MTVSPTAITDAVRLVAACCSECCALCYACSIFSALLQCRRLEPALAGERTTAPALLPSRRWCALGRGRLPKCTVPDPGGVTTFNSGELRPPGFAGLWRRRAER